jgi:aldehyde dehydrogenase (NAD+)
MLNPSVSNAAEDARRIFELQKANRWKVATTTARERAAKLARLEDSIVRHRTEIYEAMHADFRKPRAEVELTEIQSVLLEIEDARKHVAKWMRPVRAGTPLLLVPAASEIRYEPRGVVLILSPWNYPFQLLMNPLVAAVAAGNCIMVRPSSKVPRTGEIIATILRESFEESEVACLTGGDHGLADALLAMPFEHMFFTGSIPVGKKVMAAAAAQLATVTLELGGKCPFIVDETADMEKTVARAMWGKFVNAGQTCVAPDYAIVHESRVADFISGCKGALAKMYGESEEARQASAHFARIIDGNAFRRLSKLVEQSVAAGAKVEIGGRMNEAERYIAPTLLSGVGWDSPIMREEIFGPLFPVLTYRTLDEIPARIHAMGKPLMLYMFTRRRSHLKRILAHTTSGGVIVNNVLISLMNSSLPFGGVGESGQGSYHGWFGFRTFSHERSVMRQREPAPTTLFFPPYGAMTDRMVNLVRRVFTR